MTRAARTFFTVAAGGFGIEVLGVAAFGYFSSRWPAPGKILILGIFALLITLLLAGGLPRLSSAWRALLVVPLAVGLTAAVELLGWTVFRGFRHDIPRFSSHHLLALTGTTVVGIIFFGAFVLVISGALKILSGRRVRRGT